MAVSTTELVKLYLAYFGRPPDFDGVQFYTNPSNPMTLLDVENAFSLSPESQRLYGSKSLAETLDAIYMNVLNRHIDVSGLTFWSEAVNSGKVTLGQVAYNVITGALTLNDTDLSDGVADALTVQHKITASTLFLTNLNLSTEIVGYTGDAASETAREWLALVGSSNASLTTATGTVDAAILAAIDAHNSGGQTFALSASLNGVDATTTANEGQTVFFNLKTTGVAPGTQYAYSLTGVQASDVVGGSLSGLATVDINGNAVISVSLTNDVTTEGVETLTLNVAGKTKAITVADTSTAPPPTFALEINKTAVNEGDTVTYSLATTNVAVGTQVSYEILLGGNASAADIGNIPLTGIAVVGSDGRANVTLTATADLTTEALAESVAVRFTEPGVGDTLTTSYVTITDTSLTPNLDIRLTAGADTGTAFVAGAGNDTFDGSTVANSLNTADVLVGGEGNDKVHATLDMGQTVRPTLTGIETVEIINGDVLNGDAVTVDLLHADGSVNQLRAMQSQGEVIFDNVNTLAAISDQLNDQDVTVFYTDAALAGDTNVSINLDNVTDGTITIGNAGAGTGEAETITVNSDVGGNNSVNIYNWTAGAYELDITGTEYLDIFSDATVIDASGNSGGIQFEGSADAYTITGSSGDDFVWVQDFQEVTASATESFVLEDGASLTVTDDTDVSVTLSGDATVITGGGDDSIYAGGSGDVSLTLGDGDDFIDMGDELTADDTVAAGGGTDTLAVSADVVDAQFENVTSVEVLQLDSDADATLDTMAFDAGIRTINGSDDQANVVTLETQDDDLSITVSGGGSGDDVVNVENTAAADGMFTLSVWGVETVNDNAAGVTVIAMDSTGVTLNGSAGADILTGNTGDDVLHTGFNAVDVTDVFDGGAGDDTLYAEGGAVNFMNVESVTLSGESVVTEVEGGATIDVTVTDIGGFNDDVITLLNGNNTVVMGLGHDSITFGTGNDTLEVDPSYALRETDTVAGGEGTDTVSFWNGTLTDVKFTNVTSFEVAQLNDSASASLGEFAMAAGITTINGASGVGGSADNAVTITQQDDAWTLTINGGEDFTDTSGDNAGGADGVDDRAGTATNSDFDTVTVAAGGTGLLTLNVSNVEMVDASAASAAVAINVIDSPVTLDSNAVDGDGVITQTTRLQGSDITGSDFGDSIMGGSGADTIDGGVGYDSINAGGGNDIVHAEFTEFTDFASVDTLIGGSGTDTFVLDNITAGSLVGDLVLANVSGFEQMNLSVADTVALGGATESSIVVFDSLVQGQSVTLGGLTVTVTGAGVATAANVATAFATGASAGNITVTGTLSGWTADPAVGNSVNFTSTTPNANVTDLSPTLSAAASSTPVNIVESQGKPNTVTTGTTESAVFSFNGGGGLSLVNGNSVTIAGRTVSATGNVNGTQLATAFGTGTSSGNAVVSGTLIGWTANNSGGTVTFTSTTPNTDVADISYGGNVSVPAPVTTPGAPAGGTPAATETGQVTFQALTLGESVTIAGRTVTASGAATAAAVATAFSTGSSAGTLTVSGALSGWTAGGAAGAVVTFTSTTASTNVTDLSATYGNVAAATITSLTESQGNSPTNDLATFVITNATHDRNEDANGVLTVDLTAAYTDPGDRVTLNASGLSSTNHMQVILNSDTSIEHNDSVATGAGNDEFVVGASGAADVLTANDTIAAGTGTDQITLDNNDGWINAVVDFGNVTGVENIVVASEENDVTLTLQGAGQESLNVSVTTDSDDATTGALTLNADTIDTDLTVSGSSNDDSITTGSGADSVSGGDGNDTIVTNDGNDSIDGGAGNDWIRAGDGNDSIDLSAGGEDTVRFEDNTLANNGFDTITGFMAGTDDGADVLDFGVPVASSLGLDQNGGADINISGTAVVYSIVNGAATLDFGTVKAVSGNTGLVNELLVADGADAVILQAASDSSTSFNIYHVVDLDGTAGVLVSVELIGTVSMVDSTFTDLVAGNLG